MAGALPNDAFGPLGAFKAAPYLTEGEAGMSAYYSTMVVDTCRRSGRGCPWDEMTCSEAAGSGHMAVLQWARQQGCPWDGRTWIAANRMGHVDVLQWAEQNGCPHDPDDLKKWYSCDELPRGSAPWAGTRALSAHALGTPRT